MNSSTTIVLVGFTLIALISLVASFRSKEAQPRWVIAGECIFALITLCASIASSPVWAVSAIAFVLAALIDTGRRLTQPAAADPAPVRVKA